MNVLTLATLAEFWAVHPDAELPLRAWLHLVRSLDFANFAEVQGQFGSADWVAGFIVFNIGGNKYRLIVRPNFAGKRLYVRHVLTHAEYDSWRPE